MWGVYPEVMTEAHDDPTLLFLHGAGGFREDAPLARGIAEAYGARLVMPMLSDEDMTFEAWAAPIRAALSGLGSADLVVGHSFGGSILVKVLAEREWKVRRAVLLAMPNWGEGGWGVDEYAFDGPEPGQFLVLHHCLDDEVVPFDHLALNRADLPNAAFQVHEKGGHQFEGPATALLR